VIFASIDKVIAKLKASLTKEVIIDDQTGVRVEAYYFWIQVLYVIKYFSLSASLRGLSIAV
jgi:hypothetical protein